MEGNLEGFEIEFWGFGDDDDFLVGISWNSGIGERRVSSGKIGDWSALVF